MSKKWKPIASAPKDEGPLLLWCPKIDQWNRIDGMPNIVVGIWGVTGWGGGDWYSDLGEIEGGYYEGDYSFEHTPITPTYWQYLPDDPEEAP